MKLITLLLSITAGIQLLVGGLVFATNRKRTLGFLHALHLSSLGLWAGGMVFYLSLPESSLGPIVNWTRFLYFFGILSGIGFFGFSLYFTKKNTSFLIFNTNSIVSGIEFHSNNRQVIQGELYPIFFLTFFTVYPIAFLLLAREYLLSQKIKKHQTKLILMATVPVVLVASIVNLLLPVLFGNFTYAWVAPLILPTSSLTVYYAIHRYRFLNIQFTAINIGKKIVSLFFSMATGYFFMLWINSIGYLKGQTEYFPNVVIICLIFSFVYYLCAEFFYSDLFYKIFQPTSLEHFKRTIEEFKKRDATYDCLETLRYHIENIFCEKLKIGSAELVVVEASFEEKFPKLTEHFKSQKNTGLLVAKEVEFLVAHEKREIPYCEELQGLGEICLPLYNSSGLFLGCLILGEKPNRAIYSQEEIELIESLQRNFNLELTGLLYQSQLKKTVQQKTAEIKAVMRQQTDFIANSAHELRTPTAGIVFGLEHISEEEGLPKGIREMLKTVYRSSQKLQKIVQTLFEAQSYDTDQIKLDIEKIKVHSLVAELASEIRPLMEKKKIKFSTEIEAPRRAVLKADKLRLEQVLRNLLDNAAKFAPVAATVRLRVEREKGSFLFQVIDNGQGLPGDTKRHIFERFKTKDPYGSQGIGLGLYISREIVKLHQGKIWAENTVGGGATFLVELPARAA